MLVFIFIYVIIFCTLAFCLLVPLCTVCAWCLVPAEVRRELMLVELYQGRQRALCKSSMDVLLTAEPSIQPPNIILNCRIVENILKEELLYVIYYRE